MQVIKKIFVLAAMLTAIVSTCHADAIKISNLSAEQFLQGMRNVLYSEDVQKSFPIAITDLVRGTNDLKEYDLKVWAAYFGKQGETQPDGEVTLYVDSSNCVHTVKITLKENDNSAAEYSNVFAAVCNTIGLSRDEGLKLLSGGESEEPGFYHAEVERSDKIFLVITAFEEGLTRTLFIAGENND
ncbi:MAG: hypothetical protein IKZ58_06235 [Selenomonadaceae bacterium]|nr:hypothetical protein [Selenomonadaceae bacterium]